MEKKVMVEVSARHIHLSQEHLEVLFGKGYELTPKKDLSQPGQFACEERVKVVGAKKELAGVSILGPVRPETQVELSLTDARSIGVAAPVSINVFTFGTGKVSDAKLAQAVKEVFDLRPTAIIRDLDLQKPIYRPLAAYGHMGREDLGVKWEQTDRILALQGAVK